MWEFPANARKPLAKEPVLDMVDCNVLVIVFVSVPADWLNSDIVACLGRPVSSERTPRNYGTNAENHPYTLPRARRRGRARENTLGADFRRHAVHTRLVESRRRSGSAYATVRGVTRVVVRVSVARGETRRGVIARVKKRRAKGEKGGQGLEWQIVVGPVSPQKRRELVRGFVHQHGETTRAAHTAQRRRVSSRRAGVREELRDGPGVRVLARPARG